MKLSLLSILILTILSSCGQAEKQPVLELEHSSIVLPNSFSYKGKTPGFVDSDAMQPVIEWNDRLSRLNSEVGSLLGDSVICHWSDGRNITYSRDSLLSYLQAGFDTTAKLDITIAAAIPVNYTDVDDLWIYSWIFKEIEFSDGTLNSHYLHEDFRIVEGRIHEIYQFKRSNLNSE